MPDDLLYLLNYYDLTPDREDQTAEDVASYFAHVAHVAARGLLSLLVRHFDDGLLAFNPRLQAS